MQLCLHACTDGWTTRKHNASSPIYRDEQHENNRNEVVGVPLTADGVMGKSTAVSAESHNRADLFNSSAS